MRLRVMGTRCLLGLILLTGSSWSPVVAQEPGRVQETLDRVASDTSGKIRIYLERVSEVDPGALGANVSDPFIEHLTIAREAEKCLNRFLSSAPKRHAFRSRFDKEERRRVYRTSLERMFECGHVQLFFGPNGETVRCCGRKLNRPAQRALGSQGQAIEPVFALAQELQQISDSWADLQRTLSKTFAEERLEILGRYERKLVDGFPAMPWEYMWNFYRQDEPTPHQLIWLHFNTGFENGVGVDPGDSRIQPVLTLQGLGYNRYFLSKDKGVWRKLNYLGVAGIITLNGRKGVTAVRYGGVVHFGNYVSVGSTYGDGAWRVYASSNKVVDQILKIWN